MKNAIYKVAKNATSRLTSYLYIHTFIYTYIRTFPIRNIHPFLIHTFIHTRWISPLLSLSQNIITFTYQRFLFSCFKENHFFTRFTKGKRLMYMILYIVKLNKCFSFHFHFHSRSLPSYIAVEMLG